MEQVLYAKASVERRPEYRQLTLIILADGSRKFARKVPVGEAAKAHMRCYAENIQALTAALRPGSRLSFVPCRANADGSVDFPFCDAPTLSDRMRGLEKEALLRLVLDYRQALAEAFGTVPFRKTPAFVSFYGDVALPEAEQGRPEEALAVTNADMNFDNVFCLPDGRLTMIDYEWVLPFTVPLRYLMYRSLLLEPAFTTLPEAEKSDLLAALGIDGGTAETFMAMELAFLAQISPEQEKLDYYARMPGARENRVRSLAEFERMGDELARMGDALERQTALNRDFAPKWWFRLFRKADDALSRARESIRRFARQENAIGGFCTFLVSCTRIGPAETCRFYRHLHRVQRDEAAFMAHLPLTEAQQQQQRQACAGAALRFSILVPLYNTPLPFLREMVDSVLAQTYENWELCLADGSDAGHPEVGEACRALSQQDPRIRYQKLERNLGISGNTNVCLDMATGDYIALFDHDDLLHPAALYENWKAISETGADFVYSDEVVFASPNRDDLLATHFKPDFAPESLLGNNYICHLAVFRAALTEKAGRFRPAYDGSQDHDFILRLTDCAEKVAHIPKVLYYWRSHPASVAGDLASKAYAIRAGQDAVRSFLSDRRHLSVTVESAPEYPTLYHVRFPLPEKATVRVVLDCAAVRPSRIPGILENLCACTPWPGAAVTVLLSSPVSPEAGLEQRVFALPVNWRVSNQPRAARLRQAALEATEDFLVFLSGDLRCENASWLPEMLMLGSQPQIGMVGGKALFTDGRVRHAGLVLGLGRRRLLGRSYFRFAQNGGYFGQLAIAGNVSAVSAECCLISREKWLAAGGFEGPWQNALFDADCCLHLAEAGLRNVFTPWAVFRGGEARKFSMDFGTEFPSWKQDARAFRDRWAALLNQADPFYNPNLSLDDADCSIRHFSTEKAP